MALYLLKLMLIGWYVLGSETSIGYHPAQIFKHSVDRRKANILVSLSLTSERISTTNLLVLLS